MGSKKTTNCVVCGREVTRRDIIYGNVFSPKEGVFVCITCGGEYYD